MTLRLIFDKKDCFHLMGLQYLRDRPELNRDCGKVFDEIIWNNKIRTNSDIRFLWKNRKTNTFSSIIGKYDR